MFVGGSFFRHINAVSAKDFLTCEPFARLDTTSDAHEQQITSNKPTTMKIPFFLTSLVAPAVAFSTRPALVAISRPPTVALKETAAEEYLDKCRMEWDDLEKQLTNLKAEAKLHSDDDVS